MKIKYLQMTIEPWHIDKNRTQLTIEIKTEKDIYTNKEMIDIDHFEDLFSRLMRRMEHQVKDMIREKP